MRAGLKWTLVILRLAIGWHFFFEGLDKLRSLSLGPTEFNRPWTSATFLREAPGPAGPWLRRLAGQVPDWLDSIDVNAIARHHKLPDVMAHDWESYRDRFIAHHRIDDPKLLTRVQDAYRSAETRATDWLLGPKTAPAGPAVSAAPPGPLNQIQAYQQQQARINKMQYEEFPAFEHDVRHGQLREARNEARRLAVELKAGWAKQTEFMHKDLRQCLDELQRGVRAIAETDGVHTIDRLDRCLAWALTLVGGCILLGFLTRPACLLAACFLGLIYLAYPPWPSLPDSPHLDGRNIYVDQNLIEMLALVVLAMVPSGRWLGLDALVFLPWRRKAAAQPRASGISPS